MKKKLKNMPRKYQIITPIFVGITLILSALLMNSFSLPDRIDTVSFQSKSLNYENKEAGSFEVTKSTKWISKGKARVDINIDTISKIENEEKDIILVLDTSSLDNLVSIKKTLLDFVEKTLFNENSKIALITYENSSAVRTGFTKNQELLTSRINTLTSGLGRRNYYQALVSIDSILKEYKYENERKLEAIFITNNYSNVDVKNENSYYEYLKSQYPYLNTNLVWYGESIDVGKYFGKLSDKQKMTSISDLGITLLDIVNYTAKYDNFILNDVINTEYFDSNSITNVKSSNGIVRMEDDNLIWSLEEFHTGRSENLKFDISMKDTPTSEIKMISTTKENIITYKLGELEEVTTNQSNVKLPTNYQIIYEGNVPSDCELENFPNNEIKQVKEIVELSNNPKCNGYTFRGWTIITEGVESLSDNQFIMPESDVVVQAEWSKVTLEKSMDGTVLPGLSPAPVINTEKTGYPIITEYGVYIDSEVSIDFSDRDDIDNYYSVDDGATWKKYEGPFNRLSSRTVLAKSCLKDEEDDCIESSKAIEMPGDAVEPAAYDGDYSTTFRIYQSTRWINVSEEMWKRNIWFHGQTGSYRGYLYMHFYDADGGSLGTNDIGGHYGSVVDQPYTIPEGTTRILFDATAEMGTINIYELSIGNEPIFTETQYYPELTEYGVLPGYSEVTIAYFQTSVQRLYRINEGKWVDYNEEPIRLEIGDKIEAKGVDKYEIDTPTSTLTAVLLDNALGLAAYDGDRSTMDYIYQTSRWIDVSKEMWNRNVWLYGSSSTYRGTCMMYFYDTDGNNLGGKAVGTNTLYTIPEETDSIRFDATPEMGTINAYELEVGNEPVLTEIKYYPKLIQYGIEAGYNEVTIKYFQTSVQKLYRINGGEWQDYTDTAVRLEIDDVIEAKGIDKYGTDTPVATLTSELLGDALVPPAYDKDTDTLTTIYQTSRWIDVSEEMWSRGIYLIGSSSAYRGSCTLRFYDKDGGGLGSYGIGSSYIIPEGTASIRFDATPEMGTIRVYEIQIMNEPIITETKYYPELTTDGVIDVHNKVTIDYFPTAVTRLYRINGGSWQEYQDKEIWLDNEDYIETKSIDKYGEESMIVTHTAEIYEDALPLKAYDLDEDTGYEFARTSGLRIDVSKEMWGRNYDLLVMTNANDSNSIFYISYYNANDEEMSYDTITEDYIKERKTYTVPQNTKSIIISYPTNHNQTIYEIQPSDTLLIKRAKHYPKIEPTEIEAGYNTVTLNYPSSSVQKLYRVNNGEWKEYQDQSMRLELGDKIEIKGIDNTSKETKIISYTIELPRDALKPAAYDENYQTLVDAVSGGEAGRWTEYFIEVSEKMWNRKINIKWRGAEARDSEMTYLDKDGNHLEYQKVTFDGVQKDYVIPEGTTKIWFQLYRYVDDPWGTISEVQLVDKPVINETKYNSKITSNGIEMGYNTVTIDYLKTNKQKLYRINDGKWQNYEDKEIRLEIGDTIEVKGIDKNNKETEVVKYKSDFAEDALRPVAYDNDFSTMAEPIEEGNSIGSPGWTDLYIDVSEEMWNQEINVTWKGGNDYYAYMHYYTSEEEILDTVRILVEETQKNYTIPEGTAQLIFELHAEGNNWGTLTEVQPANKITINATKNYPRITPNGVEDGYNTVTINYPEALTKKQYRIGSGAWQNYEDKEIRLEIDDLIEIKGTDSENKETEIVKYKATLPYQALGKKAYDEDYSTMVEAEKVSPNVWTNFYIDVSEEMWNQEINLTWKGGVARNSYMNYRTIEDSHLGGEEAPVEGIQQTYTIPEGTARLWFELCVDEFDRGSITEIGLSNKVRMNITKYYPKITQSGIQDGYNIVTIDYPEALTKKQYRIGNGKWTDYLEKEIRLEIGDTIEARGIDSTGKETEIIKYKAILPYKALEKEAYDGDYSTMVEAEKVSPNIWTNFYIDVSEDMWNQEINLIWKGGAARNSYMNFRTIEDKQLAGEEAPVEGIQQNYTISKETARIWFELCVGEDKRGSITEIRLPKRILINPTKHYSKITSNGIEMGYNTVTVSYPSDSVQKLYRIGSGEWKNYENKEIRLEIGETIEVKGTDSSNKETEVVRYKADFQDDALKPIAYDNDFSTMVEATDAKITSGWASYFIDVSEDMWNKEINVTWKGSNSKVSYINCLGVDDENLGAEEVSLEGTQQNYTILEQTKKIEFDLWMDEEIWGTLAEVQLPGKITISSKKYFPTITSNGIEAGYNMVTVNYPETLTKKQYRINNGNWQNYENKEIRLEIDDIIEAKGTDSTGKETEIMKYRASLPSQALEKEAYDGNYSTSINAIKGNGTDRWTNLYMNVSSDMWNKEISIQWKGSEKESYLHFLNADDGIISYVTVANEDLESYFIPNNTTKLWIQLYSTSDNNLGSITEISINRPERKQTKNPVISIGNVELSKEKTINISYPEGYTNEYSLDLGNTWISYTEPITVTESMTIFSRSLDSSNNVVSSSSFKVVGIDNEEPEITLDLPEEINLKEEYLIPTSYKVGPSGGQPICKVGDKTISNTNELEAGTYTISCSIENGLGIKKDISKNILVKDSDIESE